MITNEEIKQFGVYETPKPVVSYILSMIDKSLKEDFEMPEGLSTKDLNVLDFATGPGIFLTTLAEEYGEGPILHGYELHPTLHAKCLENLSDVKNTTNIKLCNSLEQQDLPW